MAKFWWIVCLFWLVLFQAWGSVALAEDPPGTQVDKQVFTVSGTVLFHDDKPVANADVYAFTGRSRDSVFYVNEDDSKQPAFQELAHWKTDAEGMYRGEVSSPQNGCVIHVAVPGFPSKTVYQLLRSGTSKTGLNPPPLKLVIPRGETRRIRVVDSSNQPLAGAPVFRMSAHQFPVHEMAAFDVGTQIGTTDHDGYVSALLSPDTAQFIWCKSDGYLHQQCILTPPGVNTYDFFPNIRSDTRVWGANDPIELKVHRAYSVHGTILDGAVPAAGVEVWLNHSPTALQNPPGVPLYLAHKTRTDGNGGFRFSNISDLAVNVTARHETRFAVASEIMPSKVSPSGIKATLQAGSQITGTLIDIATQLPVTIDGGKVEFWGFPGIPFSGTVQPNGQFVISIPPGARGALRLQQNPFWREALMNLESASEAKPVVIPVERIESPMTDEEVIAVLPNFPKDYSLADGQNVRRMPRPYPRSREALFQFSRMRDFPLPNWLHVDQRQLKVFGNTGKYIAPPAVIFHCNQAGSITIHRPSQMYITGLVSGVIKQVPFNRIRPRVSFDQLPAIFPDYLIREEATVPELVVELNQSFQQEPRLPYRLILQEESTPFLVVHGLPTQEVIQRKTQLNFVPEGETADASVRVPINWKTLLRTISSRLNVELKSDSDLDPLLSDCDAIWPKYRADPERRQKLTEEMRRIVPRILKEQLGVESEIQSLKVPVILIESAK